jgi:hypothetical protein
MMGLDFWCDQHLLSGVNQLSTSIKDFPSFIRDFPVFLSEVNVENLPIIASHISLRQESRVWLLESFDVYGLAIRSYHYISLQHLILWMIFLWYGFSVNSFHNIENRF